jgi:hypothetical protein
MVFSGRSHTTLKRKNEIENVLFPKSIHIADPIAEVEKLEQWERKNPETAKVEREREENWERHRAAEFEALQRVVKENPEELISYLQDLKEKIEVIEIIVRKQLKLR